MNILYIEFIKSNNFFMFLGIISTIFESLSLIFRKKALNFKLENPISPRVFSILVFFGPSILIGYLVIAGKYDFSKFNEKIFFIIVLTILVDYIRVQIAQYVYKNEKISVILPYENLNKLLSVILAFFIFGGISKISFFLTILAGILIFAFSVDIKTLQVPKFVRLFTISQILQSIVVLMTGYTLQIINEIDYYILSSSFYIFLLFGVVLYRKEFKQLFKLPGKFYATRFSASAFGAVAKIISLTIIASFGIAISILLSYFYIGFLLVLSYLFLKDTPTKKNIILTLLLSILVGLGYYYK